MKCSSTAGTCVNYYKEKCLLNLKPEKCGRFRISDNPILKEPKPEVCPVCPICNGTGKSKFLSGDGTLKGDTWTECACPACKGTGKVEPVKGKCKHTDCIHYGEICCARETECDGEEFYNIMPDGEIVRKEQPKESTKEGVNLEIKNILEKYFCCVCPKWKPIYQGECGLICDDFKTLWELISLREAEVIRKEREGIVKEIEKEANEYRKTIPLFHSRVDEAHIRLGYELIKRIKELK